MSHRLDILFIENSTNQFDELAENLFRWNRLMCLKIILIIYKQPSFEIRDMYFLILFVSGSWNHSFKPALSSAYKCENNIFLCKTTQLSFKTCDKKWSLFLPEFLSVKVEGHLVLNCGTYKQNGQIFVQHIFSGFFHRHIFGTFSLFDQLEKPHLSPKYQRMGCTLPETKNVKI